MTEQAKIAARRLRVFARRGRRARARRDRRGVALIIVLTLIAITLSLSYAVMRSQGTIARIQANSDLRANARQAALAGYLAGLRQMHNASWAGADTSFSGNAGPNMTFQVSYVTGDASLAATSTSYSEFPYRVTMTVTGTATDPTNLAVSVSDHILAVVKLVPRQLQTEPATFGSIIQFTAYETGSNDFEIEPRRRIEGPVRIQGKVRLFKEAPNDSAANSRYISDLGLLRTSNNLDYRPFTGPISLPTSSSDGTTLSALTTNFGLTLTNITATSPASDWAFPSTARTYRLYTGGKVYTIANAASTLQNVSLAADPLTNPAGIFYSSGDVSIRDNVTIQGTLLASGKILVSGANVNLQPVSLPAFRGTTTPIKLPVLVASSDIEFQNTASGTVTGMLASFNNFLLDQSSQNLTLQLFGNVTAKQFTFHDCTEWAFGGGTWSTLYTLFTAQKLLPNGTANFATYLRNAGLPSSPTVTLKPETTAATYHWQTGNNPVFVPHASDPGLRWDVLSWKEYP